MENSAITILSIRVIILRSITLFSVLHLLFSFYTFCIKSINFRNDFFSGIGWAFLSIDDRLFYYIVLLEKQFLGL